MNHRVAIGSSIYSRRAGGNMAVCQLCESRRGLLICWPRLQPGGEKGMYCGIQMFPQTFPPSGLRSWHVRFVCDFASQLALEVASLFCLSPASQSSVCHISNPFISNRELSVT